MSAEQIFDLHGNEKAEITSQFRTNIWFDGPLIEK
jgi:hypothetical protein